MFFRHQMVRQKGETPISVSIEPAEDMIRREFCMKAKSGLTRSSAK